jgi:hypothetical protein
VAECKERTAATKQEAKGQRMVMKQLRAEVERSLQACQAYVDGETASQAGILQELRDGQENVTLMLREVEEARARLTVC